METFSALMALWAGNSPVNGEFASQRPMTRSCDVLLDLHLNKRLSKQSWGWWVETPSRSLWRHCNADPLNKPFSQKINASCVEIRMFRVKWLNTIADDDLVRCVARSSASAVLQQCTSQCMQSLKKGLKVWLLKVRHRPGSVSWFFSDFVRICAVYQWVIHIISDFVLSYRM